MKDVATSLLKFPSGALLLAAAGAALSLGAIIVAAPESTRGGRVASGCMITSSWNFHVDRDPVLGDFIRRHTTLNIDSTRE